MSRLSRCEKILYLISESLDRKLTFWEGLVLRWHVRMCRKRSRDREALIALEKLLQVHAEPRDAPVDISSKALSHETRERIKRILRERSGTKE